jgi:hypothetical protein
LKKVALPTQHITFLGVDIDSCSRVLTLPETKLLELKSLISEWVGKKRATKLELQRLVGKLTWACRVVKGGRTFLRRIHDLLARVVQSNHHVRITAEAREDISWWHICMESFHGSCRFSCDELLPSHCFASDACLVGGGAHYLSDWFYTNWEADYPTQSEEHINVLELLSVFHAIKRWGHLWAGKIFLIRTDNTATMSAINKGTSRSRAMMPIVRDIFWLCIKFECIVVSTHLAGTLNVMADHLSRLHDLSSANAAHALLVERRDRWVLCKEHMSISSFLFLQGAWSANLPG